MTFLVAAQRGRECLTQLLQSSGGGEGGRERERTGEAKEGEEGRGGEGRKGRRMGGKEGGRGGEEGRWIGDGDALAQEAGM